MNTNICQLAIDLDSIYRTALERLAEQAAQSQILSAELKRILQQSSEHESVLQYDPERSMPPHTAFRSLAMEIVRRAQESITLEVPLIETHYLDLLSWSDEPRKFEMSPMAQFEARLDYARGKSLVDFWARLQARLAPAEDPAASESQAVADLVQVFCRETPEALLFPVIRDINAVVMVMPLERTKGETEFVISRCQQDLLLAGCHAVATVVLLERQPELAKTLTEAANTMLSRLRSAFGIYRPRDHYYGGPALSISLRHDHVQFIVAEQFFSSIKCRMARHVQNLELVDAQLMEFTF